MNLRILLVSLTLLVSGNLLAGENKFWPGSARASAMGMTWIASSTPEDAAFANPAFLATEDTRFTVLRLRTAANSDGLSLLFGDSGDKMRQYAKDPGDLLTDTSFLDDMANFNASYDHSGPLFLSYKGEGFGLGVYSTSKGHLTVRGATLPTATLKHDFDIGTIAGLALPITLDEDQGLQLMLGATFKYLIRVRHESAQVPLTMAGTLTSPFSFSGDFRIGQAVGSDLGVAWRSPYFTVGIVWYDWFGTTLSWTEYDGSFKQKDVELGDTRINPAIGAGIAWTPSDLFGLPSFIFSDTTFAIDLRGFLDESDSIFNMLHVGFESTIMHLLTLRLGLNAGYPTAGLSVLILGCLQLDYALATEEQGRLPGQNPETSHCVSMTLFF